VGCARVWLWALTWHPRADVAQKPKLSKEEMRAQAEALRKCVRPASISCTLLRS